MSLSAAAAEPQPPGWQAGIRLTLAPRAGRTRICARRHFGPLVVQRAFYPEGATAHVLLLHPPGGLVGYDALSTQITLEPDAAALFTMPGATKIYRSDARTVRQSQELGVATGAALEWVPPPVIVYDGAHAAMSTEVTLASGARFLGWDAICLGRPACGEKFANGRISQRLRVRMYAPEASAATASDTSTSGASTSGASRSDASTPGMHAPPAGDTLYHERWSLAGGAPALTAPWGLGGRPVLATLLASPADPATLEDARRAAADFDDATGIGVTLVNGLLVARLLCDGTETAQHALEAMRDAVRDAVIGRAPHRPRIWNT